MPCEGGQVKDVNRDTTDGKRFGLYLRRLRESRKLSLDAVEELAAGYPDRITKSHLSRIENGLAEPTFRRMYALGQIYDTPVTILAERFELVLKLEQVTVDLEDRPLDEIRAEAKRYRLSGRYIEALQLYDALLEASVAQSPDPEPTRLTIDLRLRRITCLVQLKLFYLAKEETENALDCLEIVDSQRLDALKFLTVACYRLGRYTVAMLALERAEILAVKLNDVGKGLGDLAMIKGNILFSLGRIDDAVEALEESVETYASLGLEFDICRARRNLASVLISKGEQARARTLLGEVLIQAEREGYEHITALALSDLAAVSWDLGDPETTETNALRSNVISREREYLSIVFRNCYYLWRVAMNRNDRAGVTANERTLRAYLSRLSESMPEIDEFRAYLAGGAS